MCVPGIHTLLLIACEQQLGFTVQDQLRLLRKQGGSCCCCPYQQATITVGYPVCLPWWHAGWKRCVVSMLQELQLLSWHLHATGLFNQLL